MASWISEVLRQTEEAESPRQFVYWAALASIAAVMRKNVWLDKHLYKLYPNIYVLLIAKSGMRKAFPVSLAKRLVRATKMTRVIAGRNTVQAILQDLSLAYTQPQGGMVTDAYGFLAAGEFSSFIVRDQDALTILTDLYDTHDHEPEWRNLLKSGSETLTNPCITMLGASNQAHLNDKLQEIDIDGGFVGRTLMIVGTEKYKNNPLVDKPEVTLDIQGLAEYLKEIALLEGGFKWSDEGADIYKKWYMDFVEDEHEDDTGTTNRIHDHILKVAMLISLSKGKDLILKGEDINDAIMSCMTFITNVKKTVLSSGGGSSGATDLAGPTRLVMTRLLNAKDMMMSRKVLLQRVWPNCDAIVFDRVLDTLTQVGFVRTQGKIGSAESMIIVTDVAKKKFDSV